METPKEYLQRITRPVLKGLADLLRAIFDGAFAAPAHISEGFREALLGLRSPDRPTRRMSIVFFASVLGVVFVLGAFGKYFYTVQAKKNQERVAADQKLIDAEARAQELKRLRQPPPYQSLGTFTLELREEDGVAKSSGLRAAEMEIVVACSDIAACDWIKGHLDLSRGELGSLFTPTDRDKILSPGGKKAFREEIRDTLNRLLEERSVEGNVIEVLFPRFILS